MTNTINNYTKIKSLGGNINSGRSTHLATDPNGNQVVIKEFNFGGSATWDALKAIEKEAEALASLDHPQIPELLGQHKTETGYEIVMEYVDGRTLASLIGSSIDEQKLKEIAKGLLEVLDYCHGRNILHRDIKPENIIINERGLPILVDFGLARNSANVGASTSLTGTLGFMPPEQWQGIFRPASDLYALGVTLVLLATGTKTSDAASLTGKNFKLKFDLHSRFSRDFDKWLHKLTAAEVDKRPKSAKEAIAKLDSSSAIKAEVEVVGALEEIGLSYVDQVESLMSSPGWSFEGWAKSKELGQEVSNQYCKKFNVIPPTFADEDTSLKSRIISIPIIRELSKNKRLGIGMGLAGITAVIAVNAPAIVTAVKTVISSEALNTVDSLSFRELLDKNYFSLGFMNVNGWKFFLAGINIITFIISLGQFAGDEPSIELVCTKSAVLSTMMTMLIGIFATVLFW